MIQVYIAMRLVQSGIDLYTVECLLGYKGADHDAGVRASLAESPWEGVEILERYRLGSTNLAQASERHGPLLCK